MGLDGISPNQLRAVTEMNSAKLNSILKPDNNINSKAVDGLSNGQKVNPDDEKEKEKGHEHSDNKQRQNDENDTDKKQQEAEFNSYKIDLTQANKYELKVNEKADTIVITEKNTQKTVQVITADKLAVFVENLAGANGSIVNKEF